MYEFNDVGSHHNCGSQILFYFQILLVVKTIVLYLIMYIIANSNDKIVIQAVAMPV